jgi:hypothetical protein
MIDMLPSDSRIAHACALGHSVREMADKIGGACVWDIQQGRFLLARLEARIAASYALDILGREDELGQEVR